MSKILVIDDEPGVRVVITEILQRAGFETIEASTADEGLSLVREFAPPVIITDILMPGKNGIEMIMEIKEIAPDAKFIVISGGGYLPAAKYLNLADALNVDYTFEKPFKSTDLIVGAVRSLTGKPGTA